MNYMSLLPKMLTYSGNVSPLTGQDKAIKNCSPDHDRGGVKIQKKVRIAYSEFSHLWADHLAGPSNISYA